jgi:hypothetical protein
MSNSALIYPHLYTVHLLYCSRSCHLSLRLGLFARFHDPNHSLGTWTDGYDFFEDGVSIAIESKYGVLPNLFSISNAFCPILDSPRRVEGIYSDHSIGQTPIGPI